MTCFLDAVQITSTCPCSAVWWRLSDFRQYRKEIGELPAIVYNWQDVAILSAALMDADNLLAQCLHKLRVRLASPYLEGTIPRGYNPAHYESDLDALLEMLAVNNHLEYLEVIVPTVHRSYIRKFEVHNKKPISRALELPLVTKLAFLSVVDWCKFTRASKEIKCDVSASNRALSKLDPLALSNIFAFSAPPALRQVVCCPVRELRVHPRPLSRSSREVLSYSDGHHVMKSI